MTTDAPTTDSSPLATQGPAQGGSAHAEPSAPSRPPEPLATPKGGSGGTDRLRLYDRIEAFISRLSTKNNFWHRVCSLVYLPYAFRSGIRMKRVDERSFTAILPFRKFNRNWYNAMAGAALVGNSEIAGGMYVFGVCGGEYTVVCKNLEYRFLRPCFGPAVYRIEPQDDLEALAKTGKEFNITLKMNVVQQLPRADQLPKVREKRVGRIFITFHATPKAHLRQKGRWRVKPKH